LISAQNKLFGITMHVEREWLNLLKVEKMQLIYGVESRNGLRMVLEKEPKVESTAIREMREEVRNY